MKTPNGEGPNPGPDASGFGEGPGRANAAGIDGSIPVDRVHPRGRGGHGPEFNPRDLLGHLVLQVGIKSIERLFVRNHIKVVLRIPVGRIDDALAHPSGQADRLGGGTVEIGDLREQRRSSPQTQVRGRRIGGTGHVERVFVGIKRHLLYVKLVAAEAVDVKNIRRIARIENVDASLERISQSLVPGVDGAVAIRKVTGASRIAGRIDLGNARERHRRRRLRGCHGRWRRGPEGHHLHRRAHCLHPALQRVGGLEE